MSDETNKTDAQTAEPKGGEVIFKTQADFDAVIQGRLAKEKAKYADYDQTKETLATLQAEIEERKKAEMSELEKAQAELSEWKAKASEYEKSVKQFKTEQEARDAKETEKVEAAMSELTDTQKGIVNALPLYDRMSAIDEFKQVNKPGGMQGAGKGNGSPGQNEDLATQLQGAKNQRERDEIIRRSMKN